MPPIPDHPLRYAMANELHARPFPALTAPCHAVYLAVKQPQDAANRDRAADRTHLLALLERFGGAHPKDGATHFFGALGRHTLKWESHTEFVTYTVFSDDIGDRPFDPRMFDVFPTDWLGHAPGTRLTSALIRVELMPEDPHAIAGRLAEWFVPESLACAEVLDGTAIVAGDFRIDAAGHMRFAVFVHPDTGERRVGRIVQRLCEIETYKSMSMLGLARARDLGPKMAEIDAQLSEIVGDLTHHTRGAEATLDVLLAISSELENLLVKSTFRFGATGAYEALVTQRIGALREARWRGRQTFAEFMMRRFDPAMRTVKSAEARLRSMAERAVRVGDLLRTRLDVDRSAENAALLASMDRRADLQLRLQRTVEGLSVVAISYYAVNLASYVVLAVAEPMGISKLAVTAVLTPIVVIGVWLAVRRIRREVT